MATTKTSTPGALRLSKKTSAADAGRPPSDLIDARIKALGDWRGELLACLRAVIKAAEPGVTEEWKWNTPVWSSSGIICTGETYKKAVKLTFARGAELADPARLFNSSLEGKLRRAIDFPEGAHVDAAALGELIRAAAAMNKASSTGKGRTNGEPG